MINVTEKAVDALANSLDSTEAAPEQSLRLALTPQGEYGLAIDEQREGDQVIKQEERPVLLVAEEVSTALHGAVLDVVDSAEGQRLTLRMAEQD